MLAADGTIIRGANIENASYGLCQGLMIGAILMLIITSGGTICAERTAVVKAVVGVSFEHDRYTIMMHSQSEGKRSFAGLAVVTSVFS